MAIDRVLNDYDVRHDKDITNFRRMLKKSDAIAMADTSQLSKWQKGLITTEKLLDNIKFNNAMRKNALTDVRKFIKWLAFIGWEREDY